MVGLAGLLAALAIPFLPLTTPPAVPELELSTERAAPGDPVDVVGRGYAGCIPETPTGEPEPPEGSEEVAIDPTPVEPPPPPPVIIRWESELDPQPLGETTLDPDGYFSTTVTVPADAGAEPFYLVSASCRPGPGLDEISESAVIVVVTPTEPSTTDPPPTSDPPPTTDQVGPTSTSVPTPALTPEPDDFAATPTSSTGSGVLPAAFVAALLGGLGLFGLARAIRRRSHRRPRTPSVSAVAAPAPPGFLDVHRREPERTVALRVAVRVEPGVLTVHRPEE